MLRGSGGGSGEYIGFYQLGFSRPEGSRARFTLAAPRQGLSQAQSKPPRGSGQSMRRKSQGFRMSLACGGGGTDRWLP